MMVSVEQLGPPIDLRHCFAPQRRRFLGLLRQLDEEDWERPTACDGWRVADLVAHMAGDLLGRLAGLRDDAGHSPGPDESVETFVDRVNHEWVVATRRLSPRLLIDLLETMGPAHDRAWAGRELDSPSIGVSWAGIDPAPLWLDAAREVTEHWVHEMQVREAVGQPGDAEPGTPVVLDVFARGLPSALSGRVPATGPTITVLAVPTATATAAETDRPSSAGPGISGALEWHLAPEAGRWWLVDRPAATQRLLTFPADQLWRRWTRQPSSTLGRRSSSADPASRAVLDHVAIVHSRPDG